MFGVYQIRNTTNGRLYIGSTIVGFEKRWKSHQKQLRLKSHPNRHLRHAWALYGENAFVFEIVEVVSDVNTIASREQYWIDYHGIENLYNIVASAYRPPTTGSPERFPGLVAPWGEVFAPIVNMKKFAESRRLRYGSLYPVAKGWELSYMGWTHVSISEDLRIEVIEKYKSRNNTYSFVSPDGIAYRNIKSVAAFSSIHKLDNSAMCKVWRGGLTNYKGWRRLDAGQEPTPYADEKPVMFTLVAPNGERHEVKEFKPFCKAHGLNPGCVNHLIKGKYSQHKGWKLG